MIRGVRIVFCLFLITLILPTVVFADEATENVVSKVLETFDSEDGTSDWHVQGSKFVTEGYPMYKTVPGFPWNLYGAAGEDQNHEVLGATAKFDRQGFNYLEIVPVKKGDNGELEANPIPIPGRVKQFDLWVWGSNYDYTLEVQLRDYSGRVFVLPIGNLNYTGWKNLRIQIPSYIPQSTVYIPSYRELELVKFVVRTSPIENVSGFDIYFDQIKVLTDIFITRFDGDEFTDPEVRESIWGTE